jgi:glyoxylase I family protein
MFNKIHHVAIICSDYVRSKDFYVNTLGLTVVQEVYREARKSYKLDLAVNGHYQIELFSFEVNDLDAAVATLNARGVVTEPVRVDEYTGKRFTFFTDPDKLPLEIYER